MSRTNQQRLLRWKAIRQLKTSLISCFAQLSVGAQQKESLWISTPEHKTPLPCTNTRDAPVSLSCHSFTLQSKQETSKASRRSVSPVNKAEQELPLVAPCRRSVARHSLNPCQSQFSTGKEGHQTAKFWFQIPREHAGMQRWTFYWLNLNHSAMMHLLRWAAKRQQRNYTRLNMSMATAQNHRKKSDF